jgi:outer membrane protein
MRILVFLLAALPVSAAAAQTPMPPVASAASNVVPARPLQLDEAVRLAQQNAPATVQARGQLRTSDAQVRRAWAAYLPSVNLTASSGNTQGVQYIQGQLVPLQGNPWSYSNGVSANLQIFDGFARWNEVNRSRATQGAAEANDVVQRYQVALNVKQQFFNVLAALESESAAQAQIAQAEQQLRAATARVAAGAATKSDSLRAVIQVGDAQVALLTARNDLNLANAALTRLVAARDLVTAAPEDSAAPIDLALDSAALVTLALRAPSVQSAEADLVAARATQRAARGNYWPTLNASYSYNVNTTSASFQGSDLLLFGEDNPNSKRLNFSLSLPIFNGWQRETEVVQSSVAVSNAEATLRDVQLGARQTLTQAFGAFRLAQQRVSVAQASVAAGQEDLRVQEERYRLGAATQLDVLTSQVQLNQARTQLIAARYDARVAKAQLEALVGRDL